MGDKKNILYLDAFGGVSGDMLLSGLLEIGLDESALLEKIKSLNLPFKKFASEKQVHGGISGTHVTVDIEPAHGGAYSDIKKAISSSTFSEDVKQKAINIFERLLKVEAKIHNKDWKEIHLHEVGSADAIIDITGVLFGFEFLGINEFFCSSLPLGSGETTCQHGIIPLPGPATLELLKNFQVNLTQDPYEKVTPTGAVLVSSFFQQAKIIPQMAISRTGYGFGTRQIKNKPNYLRLILGTASSLEEFVSDSILKVEANIDDMTPEILGYTIEKLLFEGALDAAIIPVIMKKGRPGYELQVLCRPENLDHLISNIFEETTTFGIRILPVERIILEREVVSIKTIHGDVPVKVGRRGEKIISLSPEYEACKELAKEKKFPLREIIAEAIGEARKILMKAT